MLAVMLAFLNIPSYFLSTWGVWLVSISLTFAPLWFNPQTFIADVAWDDFKAWRNWMLGAQDHVTEESWCASAVPYRACTHCCVSHVRVTLVLLHLRAEEFSTLLCVSVRGIT